MSAELLSDADASWAGVTRIELTVIMVTDLVGSTAVLSRIGGARFDVWRREHDALVRDAVEELGGRAVKSTGDGLLTAFPTATAALEAAVAAQRNVELRNRGADVGMGVRIGISIGDASVDGGDYFGIPPTEATRLCGVASRSEIVISDAVRAALFDRTGHWFEPVGPLTLKGMREPVRAWRVVWRPRSAPADRRVRLELAAPVVVGPAPAGRGSLEVWERGARPGGVVHPSASWPGILRELALLGPRRLRERRSAAHARRGPGRHRVERDIGDR